MVTLPPEAARLSDDWGAALGEWAIPLAILEAAPESPWGFPPELFACRGERSIDEGRSNPAHTTSGRSRPWVMGARCSTSAPGEATWLPLAARCTGSWPSTLRRTCSRSPRGMRTASACRSPWWKAAGRTSPRARPPADVAVCGHVAYNAPDLGVFLQEISAHARRRVVLELTDRHPLSWMNDLWLRFHGVVRPDRPRAGGRRRAHRALGFEVHRADRLDTEDGRKRLPTTGGRDRARAQASVPRRRPRRRGRRSPRVSARRTRRTVDGRSARASGRHAVVGCLDQRRSRTLRRGLGDHHRAHGAVGPLTAVGPLDVDRRRCRRRQAAGTGASRSCRRSRSAPATRPDYARSPRAGTAARRRATSRRPERRCVRPAPGRWGCASELTLDRGGPAPSIGTSAAAMPRSTRQLAAHRPPTNRS